MWHLWHLPVASAERRGEGEIDPAEAGADEDEDEEKVMVSVIVRLRDPLAGGEDDDDGDQAGDAHNVQHHPQHRLDHISVDDWGKNWQIDRYLIVSWKASLKWTFCPKNLSIHQIPNVTQFCSEWSFNIV